MNQAKKQTEAFIIIVFSILLFISVLFIAVFNTPSKKLKHNEDGQTISLQCDSISYKCDSNVDLIDSIKKTDTLVKWNMKTTNFTLKEFTRSDTAERLGIDNSPSENETSNIHKLMEVMQEIRNAINTPIIVTSGFRSHLLNIAVKYNFKTKEDLDNARNYAASTSFHTFGRAVDFKIKGWSFDEHLEFVEKLKRGGIIDLHSFDKVILETSELDGNFIFWIHFQIQRFQMSNRKTTLFSKKKVGQKREFEPFVFTRIRKDFEDYLAKK